MTTEPGFRAGRRGARTVLVAFLALAVGIGGCGTDVVSPQPATPDLTSAPTQTPVPGSAMPTVPTSPAATEAPDPTALISADCGQVVTVTKPRAAPRQGLAVFSTADGVAIYGTGNNTIAPLASDGSRPRFRTPGVVTFVRLREESDDEHTFGQDSLVEVDLGTKHATDILQFSDSILAYDWNGDGTVLAYLLRTQTPTLVGPHLLCAFDSRTGKTSLLRRIENPFGTGIGQHEETAVSWSLRDEYILVTDTAARPSLFVISLDGRDTTPPQNGTFGRWMSDIQALFQEDPQNAGAAWEWMLMSAASGATRPANFPNTAFRPAAAPSGNLIAFDDGDPDRPAVFVFDTVTHTTKKLADGYVAPIWIGPEVVAVTAVKPCLSEEFCDIPWVPQAKTVAINVDTGEVGALALPTTLNEATRYGTIDVLLP